MIRGLSLICATLFFACSNHRDNSLNETAHRFIDKFFLNPDYASLESLTDSAAAEIIRYHIRYQMSVQKDSAEKSLLLPAGYTFIDSSVYDSTAEYMFRLFFPDPAVFAAPANEGFLRLSRYRRTDWKVVDFGYRLENRFAN